jgi:hypothetical protein
LHVVDKACGMTLSSAMQAIGAEVPRSAVSMSDEPNLPPDGHQQHITAAVHSQLTPVLKSLYVNRAQDGIDRPISHFACLNNSLHALPNVVTIMTFLNMLKNSHPILVLPTISSSLNAEHKAQKDWPGISWPGRGFQHLRQDATP